MTAAGAFRLRQSESATWSAVSTVALSVAGAYSVVQMVVGYVAYAIAKYTSGPNILGPYKKTKHLT